MAEDAKVPKVSFYLFREVPALAFYLFRDVPALAFYLFLKVPAFAGMTLKYSSQEKPPKYFANSCFVQKEGGKRY